MPHEEPEQQIARKRQPQSVEPCSTPSNEPVLESPVLPNLQQTPNNESCSSHDETSEPIPLAQPRRSGRNRRAPCKLQDYYCDSILQKVSSPHPLSGVISYNHLTLSHKVFSIAVTSVKEPRTYNEAIQHDCWKDAMNVEIKALQDNATWELTDLPPGKTPIGCKWVYKIKLRADGSVECYKARLVAKGYTQQLGIDYIETFSPVARLTTIRTFLAVAASRAWHIQQLDINNAFLHGDLDEEVYMVLPPGFQGEKPNQLCRLLRSLYGLKQASQQWNAKLCNALLCMGFNQSKADPSLFTKGYGSELLALLIYVDDILVASPNLSLIQELKTHLHNAFKIKDLGTLGFFLGIEAHLDRSGLNLCQRKYTLNILSESGFLDCKPVSTPMVPGHHLDKDNGTLLSDAGCYRRLVGRLLYHTATRPEITYAVQQLSQFVDAPTNGHFTAAHRILRYIKKAPGQGIFYPKGDHLQLKDQPLSRGDKRSRPQSLGRPSKRSIPLLLPQSVSWAYKIYTLQLTGGIGG
nr:uncharacterized protein LOC109184712 [Ipomoea trifida]